MVREIELETALKLIDEYVLMSKKTETVELAKATGLISSEDVKANRCQPPFDRSPLDGFALISSDTKGADSVNPVALEVIEKIYAGQVSQNKVEPGKAIRLMTGAPIPKGADCVVRQECCQINGNQVLVFEELGHHENYCFKGEDYEEGQVLVGKGEKLDAIKLGILAGAGYTSVKVYQNPVVGVITTGDEVCPPGAELIPGKIHDSNCMMITGRIEELGCKAGFFNILGDDIEEVSVYIKEIIDKVDCIITTGALSVGEKDIIHPVLDNIKATKIFQRVIMKPGTPASLSIYKGKPILSLSGNPFAAIATFEILGRPMLARIKGDNSIEMVRTTGIVQGEFKKKSFSRRFIRANYENGYVTLRKANSSGVLASMAGCNCIIDIPAGNQGLSTGDQVKVLML